jgi:YVTN family beta-propeller protein
VNQTKLGSFGNDILVYGGKMYIVMNGSSYVAVVDKRTAQSIKQITAADGADWQPRYAIPYNGKILVSAWDGTVSVIDTTSLNIVNTVAVGANPEGLAVLGNTLYVANSGGLNYPNYDSTVSVVDLNTMTQTKKITVGLNPNKVAVNSSGNIFVFAWGNYNDVPAKIYEINGNSQTLVDSTSALSVGDKMLIYNDIIYLDGTGSQPILTLNSNNIEGNFTNYVTDGTTLQYPYGISIDAANNNVYVTDAINFTSPGKVYCFDNTGKLKYSFTAGISPDKVVFLR